MEPVEDETQQDKIDFRVMIRRVAEIEILEAFVWYEEQLEDLGFEFLQTLDEAVLSLQYHPQSYQIVYKNIRRVLLRKFPYAVFYIVENDKIIVLACLHQKRHRDEWLNKTPDE
jgi:plasmid stabilization system protein ParE